MSTPLDVGVDHVFLSLSHSDRSAPALAMIEELAAEYGLTIWDPQDGSAHRPVQAPTREAVTAWWLDLLAGRCSPAATRERVRPWVEETPEFVDDPITAMGIQQLYGLSLRADLGEQEIRAQFQRWQTHGERFDADPDGWQRDRLLESVHAIRRTQGPERAQALALQLVARGSLSTEEVSEHLSGR